MNILLCYNYAVGNVGSNGLFDTLLKDFPETLAFEKNFEQVLGMAKCGELDKLIVWGAGYNWSKAASDANLIMVEDVVREIHEANPAVRIFAVGLNEDFVPPEGVTQSPRFVDTTQDVIQFITGS